MITVPIEEFVGWPPQVISWLEMNQQEIPRWWSEEDVNGHKLRRPGPLLILEGLVDSQVNHIDSLCYDHENLRRMLTVNWSMAGGRWLVSLDPQCR